MSKVSGLKDLTLRLAKQEGISVSAARKQVDAVINVMLDAIVDGGVSIKSTFTIKPVLRKGRQGKCAFNGKKWKTEDRLVLHIDTGCILDEALNEGSK